MSAIDQTKRYKKMCERFLTLPSENSQGRFWKIRIELDVEKRKEMLRRLYDMGISREVLFPDLDGFAKSLRARIAYPETLGVFE